MRKIVVMVVVVLLLLGCAEKVEPSTTPTNQLLEEQRVQGTPSGTGPAASNPSADEIERILVEEIGS